MNIITTDEMDHITPEERTKLMAYCENDESWWKFEGSPEETFCPTCQNKPSKQIGFQPMTQRTFNPLLHGKKKLKKHK